jgi:hypothetical protein
MISQQHPAWLEPLLMKLSEDRLANGLLLCPSGHFLGTRLKNHLAETRLTCLGATGPLPLSSEPFDVAVLAEVLEHLESHAARELLAALRDRLARHTLIWVDLERSCLPAAELRALGFRQHACDGAQALFGFDLYDYKARPDWLNARFWAHPERWDRHRW